MSKNMNKLEKANLSLKLCFLFRGFLFKFLKCKKVIHNFFTRCTIIGTREQKEQIMVSCENVKHLLPGKC